MIIVGKKHDYRSECSMIEVTSMSRPDVQWRYIDKAGHLHRWFYSGIMTNRYDTYRLDQAYYAGTLVKIIDAEATEDEPAIWHYECPICGEVIWPGTCADQYQQFIPGIRRFWVDDVPVSEEQFKAFMREDGLLP